MSGEKRQGRACFTDSRSLWLAANLVPWMQQRFPAVLTSTGWGLRACSVSGCEQWEQQLLHFYIQMRLQQWRQLCTEQHSVLSQCSWLLWLTAHLTCFLVMMSTIWPLPGEEDGWSIHSSGTLPSSGVPSMGSAFSLPPLHLSSFSQEWRHDFFTVQGRNVKMHERALKICKSVVKMEGTIKGLTSNYWVKQVHHTMCLFYIL